MGIGEDVLGGYAGFFFGLFCFGLVFFGPVPFASPALLMQVSFTCYSVFVIFHLFIYFC